MLNCLPIFDYLVRASACVSFLPGDALQCIAKRGITIACRPFDRPSVRL